MFQSAVTSFNVCREEMGFMAIVISVVLTGKTIKFWLVNSL